MTEPLSAAAFYAAKLAYETDPADLAAARAAGAAPLVIDVRNAVEWEQGHLPQAHHVPLAELAGRIGDLAPDPATAVVVYCWGPGCNGSTRGALALAELGYTNVRELIGGYEYWVREGFDVVGAEGRRRSAPDPLAAPVG
ncbi:sulfurtransferase [Galactobacter valiniphilus]|uniref:Sulfurtransferase n=1 Tax=Galactobacter valiniphilus TaxID=2676122 RepID=A0A399JH49_9MICC|nr:rhodanese-like domain-containing protein [Galactobacter valiniphilus]RII43559.1 sulfurtransferase [Galactobacter valiniphilus]